MGVRFITVFKDAGERKTCKLLLYHELTENVLSTNEKEQKIGMIKGMWDFAGEFSGESEYCHVELESYDLVIIKTEAKYFLVLGFEDSYTNQWNQYRVRLSQCYQFFIMQYGLMGSLQDEQLTQSLNEHFIPFWDEINLIPNYFQAQNVNCLLSDKMFPCCQPKDILDSTDEVKEWETYIKTKIIHSKDNYPNIKDICIYHLPKNNKDAKRYGYLTNFNSQFKSLSTLTNWLVHLDSIYGSISSHGLAGTMSLSGTDEQIELDAHESDVESSSNLKTVWDNVTLPLNFTIDAIKDIGHLTGVSSSFSMLASLKPWNPWGSLPDNKSPLKDDNNDHYRWLISPSNPNFLPKVYQLRQFYLEFDEWKKYNVLFWNYKDIVAVLIFETNFEKIWEESYLMGLQEFLWNGMSLFYEQPELETRQTKFDYTIFYKEESMYYSTIPIWKNGVEEQDSALKLVIKGLDETLNFLSNNANRKSSIATVTDLNPEIIMAEDRTASEDNAEELESKIKGSSMFNHLNQEQCRELRKELTVILESLSLDRIKPATSEKLLKLNNGLMVYLYEDNYKLAFLIKNWFNNPHPPKSKRSTAVIESLGPDAMKWWDKMKDHEPS